jgi:Cys-rich repeat protein
MLRCRRLSLGAVFGAGLLFAACGGSNTIVGDAGVDGAAPDGTTPADASPDVSPPPPDASPPPPDASSPDGSGPACTSDAQCSFPLPYCDPSALVCVECLGDPNCANFGNGRNTCDLGTHTCVQCATDAQCGGGRPYCAPGGTCVACLSDGNCTGGQKCDPNTYRCVNACTTDTQCGIPTPYCNTVGGYCVQCLGSANCANNQNNAFVCNTATDTCVQCLANTDCGGGRPYCFSGSNQCVECLTNANCGTNGLCLPDHTCQ